MTPMPLYTINSVQRLIPGGIHDTEEGSMDNTPAATPHTATDEFSPVGTLLFVMIMLLGYVVYWGYIWFLVVIERGGN